MTERLRSGNSFVNSANISAKMSNDLTPRKTMLIVVIVVGCFAVLWPKVFYPMLVGSANQHIKPSPIDKTTGCCDVISETDVNTIKIMSELCRTIIKKDDDLPLTGREIVAKCQKAVLETCGIDISEVLQEHVRLGQSVKQILDEIRSLNGSLCLKYNFGVAPGSLGVPHRVTIKTSPSSVRQERPLHLRSELVHPAFRERGRAIPQPQAASPRTTTRVVEGRPGPIPGMRPTIGGAGHVVPPPKQSTGSMGLIMPIYTIGIVIFFTYTVLKIIFKKQPEALYPPVEPDPNFRREVFESNRGHAPKLTREGVSSKLGDAELDQLRQRLRETELAMERIVEQMAKVPLKLQNVVANGNVLQEEEQPSVKVLGMETTASCEGGKKWSRPNTPVLPTAAPSAQEPVEPPQEIFLEGALPPQSHLLVADSATEAEKINSEEDPAVVLAGKMTLSVISLDSSENGTEEDKKQEERSSGNVSDEFEKIEVETDNLELENANSVQLLEQIQNEIKEIENDIITEREDEKPLPELTLQTEIELVEKENDQRIDPTLSATPIETLVDKIEIGQQLDTEVGNKSEETPDIGKEIVLEDSNNVPTSEIEVKAISEGGNKENVAEAKEEDESQTKTEPENLVEEIAALSSSLLQQSNTDIEESQPAETNITEEKLDEDLKIEETATPELPSNGVPEPPVSDTSESNVSIINNLLGIEEKPPAPQENAEEQKQSEEKSETVEVTPKVESAVTTKPELETGTTESAEALLTPSTGVKESFEKLNEAISDLASEFRSKEEPVEDEVEEELGDDEEIEYEYEYEESDNEAVEDEIRNVNRLEESDGVGVTERLNGEDQEHSKYGTTSSATLAENDISDEQELGDEDDDEVQEIIEYISDDEEEIVDEEPAETNTNHLPDQIGPQ